MATVDDLIITPSLRLILQEDAVPTPSEKADALGYLNELLNEWNAEKLTLFQEFQEQFPLTQAMSYTIGPTGVFNTVRPEYIVSAFFRDGTGTIDYPMSVDTTKAEWDRIALKVLGGFPSLLWYDRAYPLGVINVWRQGQGTLFLTSMKQLASFAALTDVVSLPAGYQSALGWNLKERLLIAFNQPARPDVSQLAAMTKGTIRRHNIKNEQAINEASFISNNLGLYDINRGW